MGVGADHSTKGTRGEKLHFASGQPGPSVPLATEGLQPAVEPGSGWWGGCFWRVGAIFTGQQALPVPLGRAEHVGCENIEPAGGGWSFRASGKKPHMRMRPLPIGTSIGIGCWNIWRAAKRRFSLLGQGWCYFS